MGGPWCKVRKSTGRLKQGTHNSMVEVKARVDGNGGVHKRERTVLVRLYGIECRCDVLRPPCRYKPCMYSYHEERISKNTDIMSLKILWRPNFLAREWYRGIIDCDAAVYKITKVFFPKEDKNLGHLQNLLLWVMRRNLLLFVLSDGKQNSVRKTVLGRVMKNLLPFWLPATEHLWWDFLNQR